MQHYHRRTLGFSRVKAHSLSHHHLKQAQVMFGASFLILSIIAFIIS